MEVSGKKHSDQDRTFCQPCFQDGESIQAGAFCIVCKEFLCSTCEDEHRTLKATKRHTLLDKTNMPTSMLDKFNEEDNNMQCDIHPKEFIKYYCPTHQTVKCGHCAIFEHRSCKISLISEISDPFKNGQDYSDIKSSIANLLKDVNDCISDVESNIEMVLKIGEDEVKELKDYREKVNNFFDEREKSLLEKIEQIKEMDKTRLVSLKPRCDNIKAKIDEIKLKLDVQERNSANLFIESMRVKNQVECLRAALNDISKDNTINRYAFIKDTATERLLDANTGLGIVSEDKTSGKQTVPVIDLIGLTFTPGQVIPVKSPSDTGNCRLTNMLLLPEDRLLVTDFDNKTLKVVDLHTSTMVSQIKLPGNPWGMCLLPRDRVALCLYSKKSIIFLENRGQLTEGTSIKVDGNCFAITYHNSSLVVSFQYGKVVKMDIAGIFIKSADTGDGQALFRGCFNLVLIDHGKKADIFVSDLHKHTITKLDEDLNVLQTIKDPAMQSPRSITAVGSQLIICSFGSHKILHLDLSSGKILELLGRSDGIQHPYSAVYSPEQNKLYITSKGSGIGELNNNVLVYKT